MSLEFTPHILPLLGAALLAVFLLPTAWKNRRDPIALWFGATLVALFVWSVGYTLEIMAVHVLDKIFLANLQFLGVPAIIVCWWEMVRRHVGMRPVPRPITAILWAVPILTMIVAFWNPATPVPGHPAHRKRAYSLPGPARRLRALVLVVSRSLHVTGDPGLALPPRPGPAAF